MLKKINLKNFKGFQNLENLEIKPITILCGANSCGKTSIIHSLLLQKQTRESRSKNILFNGKYIHLGDFETVINGTKKNEQICLSYEYEIAREKVKYSRPRTNDNLSRCVQKLTKSIVNLKANNQFKKLNLTFEVKLKSSGPKKALLKPADIESYSARMNLIKSNDEIISGPFVAIKKENEVSYSLEWRDIAVDDNRQFFPSVKRDGIAPTSSNHKINDVHVSFDGLIPMCRFNVNALMNSNPGDPWAALDFLNAMNEFLSLENREMSYIGPLREEPSRRYIYENEIIDIGVKGENAAYIYQTEQDNNIKKHYSFDNGFSLVENVKLSTLVTHWLKLMGINSFLSEQEGELIRLKMLSSSCTETQVNIADVGFGVSQIFPILLEGLRMKENGSLVLEQPEIHLHPGLQMKMADYFISLALSGKNVIVETHSDHIINRLVRRIVEDEEHSLSDIIAIYFIKNDGEDGTYIEEINISSEFGITNWPDGFFDQTASEQELIIRAGINKRKKNRGLN
ncbi:TPA: DUF3696 domain-containing protein [Aeromonas dhakensis]|uniref:DUF3696 domain-containing protein n=1 Tax=Aeromonas TaxID=642 RepID=UPI0009E2EE80|nr:MULTISPECIES: DUF3696 domain-containing protein [Aeromonas]UCM60468.1 DUF3696 domain-containing protein [Aeromonas hydrophila]HDX8356083.1 DUF3696 domain-containing protein [Aeromonas dhakensis]